jgi:outer membrane receptor for ferric coprogen and ferric-rhodotorulic acid
VPISITALTQDSLDQRGIKDFSDVVRFTPGVAFDFLNYNHQTNSYDANGNLLASPAYRYTTGCWPL